jgi:NCS1 family nucleobase:cation symporter-1
LGVGVALIGLGVPSLHFLYDYAWFVGFFMAGGVYGILMKLTPPAPTVTASSTR